MRFFRGHEVFSKADIAEAVQLVATEGPRRRALMNVTMAHRSFALRQSIVLLVISALTMSALYGVASSQSTIAAQALVMWGLGTIANLALRIGLTWTIFAFESPVEVVRSTPARLIPLAIAVLATEQWLWTISLFVGPDSGVSLIVFGGLLAASVAAMALWPTSPAAAFSFVVITWSAMFFQMATSALLTGSAIGAIGLMVGLVLWNCAYLQVKQIREILNRSDEVNVLLEGVRNTNADLHRANETLSALRTQATSELTARSLFFNSASHDFRQRLHAMKLLANSAMRSGEESDHEQDSLRRLVHSVEDVERYITDVLDFARIDHAMLRPDRQVVRVQSIFQSLELSFSDMATTAGVTLFLRPTNLKFRTDAGMLQRILENLVSNALKSSSTRVLVAVRRQADVVKLQVWDRGLGIDESELQSIFLAFRTTKVTRAGYAGAGLGMAIVKRFADCLDYLIDIKSRVGHGTVVTLRIPVSDVI